MRAVGLSYMNYKILVVEDDTMIQSFLRITLESEGYMVLTAASVVEMRAQFQLGGIDLVVLDLGLPDGDGMDLVSEIRADSSIPIIVASARKNAKDRVEALRRGANDYLTKPFDPTELLLRLGKLLNIDASVSASGPASSLPLNEAVPPKPEYRPPPAPKPVSNQALPLADTVATETTMSAESSLQMAAKKSAPSPIEPPRKQSTGSVDKSVLIAGFLAVVAFSGAGVYWLANSMGVSTERFATDTERQPRRGVLNPPSDPSVKIAQSSAQQDNDPLSRSVTSRRSKPITPKPLQSSVQQDAGVKVTPEDPMAWVAKSNCKALPDVSWWRVKTHQEIVRFVDQKHGGDWQPYLNNWRARIVKLQDIASRGSGIKTSSGEVLKDKSLSDYIRDTSDRIMVIQCLSRHARMAKKAAQ